jgi:2-polyprenyl-3-methyl-5-hydroxy-6-metoxy-1,4-benzoquinol methylase
LKEIFQREVFTDDQEAIRSVGEKYQVEAFQYRKHLLKEFENLNLNIVRAYIKKNSKILVAGSGIGHEAVSIAKMGCQVLGIDISPKMIEISTEKAAKAGVGTRFELMDVSNITIKDTDYAAVIFTPAVYSFIPHHEVRIRMLNKMHQILESDGKIIFDVKTYRNLAKFLKVSLSNLFYKLASFFRREIKIEFGDWHTKFLDIHGNFHYSYTKYFTRQQIKREIKRANYKVLNNIQRLYVIQKVR